MLLKFNWNGDKFVVFFDDPVAPPFYRNQGALKFSAVSLILGSFTDSLLLG
jgi:hypothetical protein